MRIIIPGTFATLNEYIDACKRSNGSWNKGNAMKQRDQRVIMAFLPRMRIKGTVSLHYTFYEPSKRRDQDNVAGYFHKIFQDSLVCAGIIPNDGWKYVNGMSDTFEVDNKKPRIEVVINEQ